MQKIDFPVVRNAYQDYAPTRLTITLDPSVSDEQIAYLGRAIEALPQLVELAEISRNLWEIEKYFGDDDFWIRLEEYFPMIFNAADFNGDNPNLPYSFLRRHDRIAQVKQYLQENHDAMLAKLREEN